MGVLSVSAIRNIIVAVLVAVGSASTAPPVRAQPSMRPAPQVQGIQGQIGAINTAENRVAVQVLLTNNNDSPVYIVLVGGFDAALSNGGLGRIWKTSGPVYCHMYQEEPGSIENCLKNKSDDINYYSYIAPHEALSTTIVYEFDQYPRDKFPIKSGMTISFSVKLMTRFSLGKEGLASVQKPTPPRILNLNFAAIPLGV